MVDTNLLLSHPETFKLIVSTKNWSVVIPNCGMFISGGSRAMGLTLISDHGTIGVNQQCWERG